MHILSKLKIELKAAVEAGGPSEETFYKEWDDKQRKQYITEHPDSKYAQEKDGSKPSIQKKSPQKEVDEEALLQKVRRRPESIRKIKNPSEKVQLEAVKKDGNAIVYIDNPSEKVQLEAVKDNYYALRYIENPTEEMQLAAIENTNRWTVDSVFELLKNPTEKAIREGIKKSGYIIKYAKNPSKELQLEAIKTSPGLLKDIKNPTDEMKWVAIKSDGEAIKYIENPSEEMQLEAIKHTDGSYSLSETLEGIKNPTEKVQWAAIKLDPSCIQYIKNPSEKMQSEIVKQNGKNIRYIKDPSEELQMMAIKDDGSNIMYIENPTEKAISESLKEDIKNIQYIDNPSEKVKKIAEQIRKEKPYLGQGRGDLGNDAEEIANALSKELPGEFEFDSYDAGSGYEDSIMTYHSPDGKDIDLTFDGYAMQWIDPDSGEMIHDGSGFNESAIEDIKNFLKTKKKSTRKSWIRDYKKAKDNLAF